MQKPSVKSKSQRFFTRTERSRSKRSSSSNTVKKPAPRVKIDSSFLKIGQAAKALGVSIDTLRRWEKAGKIETQRTPGGTRLYSLSSLKTVNPTIETYHVEVDQTNAVSTEELLKKTANQLSVLGGQLSDHSQPVVSSSVEKSVTDQQTTDQPESENRKQKTDNRFFTRFLVTTALCLTLTLILTGWIAAFYLIQPKAAKQLFQNNIAAALFKPFHLMAEGTITAISPKKARQLGFAQPEPPPKPYTLNPKPYQNVLAVTASSPFLEVNSDTQINGSLFVRDSLNGLSLEATSSAGTMAFISGDTTLTVTNNALLDQDVSTTATPSFSTLNLSATTNQLSSGGINFTLPATATTLIGKDTTDTLTKKSMSGSSNTFTNIPNSALTNSKVTVTAGTNLTGGGDVTLGSSISIALKDSPSVTSLTTTGIVSLADGTAAAPSLTFTSDTDTGLYRIGTNKIGLITGGSATSGITIDAFGNLGVGTISPGAALAISGNAGIGFTGSSAVAAPGLGLAVQGNLGIGTTTANYNLSVIGTTNITGNVGIGGSLTLTSAGVLSSGLSVSGFTSLSDARLSSLIATGNIGIGATTSSNKLDVWGNARIAGTLTVDSTSNISGISTFGQALRAASGLPATPSYSFTNLTNAGLWTNGDGLLLTTNGSNTSGITVTGAGNVGIGTTSPSFQLQTTGNVGIGGSLTLTSAGVLSSGLSVSGFTSLSDARLSSLIATGNIGIGATTSSNKLDVWGNARIAGTGTFDSTLTALNGLIGFSGVTAPTSGLAVSGNLGVGTTSPATALHIVGQTTVTDKILASTGSIDVGTTAIRFGTMYADTVNATNLIGTVIGGQTDSADWTINSDNTSADTEAMSVTFERGSSTPNAVIGWDTTNKEFDFNSGLNITGTIASTYGLTLTGTVYDITTGTNQHLVLTPNGSGNVGIGTTEPGSSLGIAGNATIGFGGAISIAGPSNGLGISGNLGIGTTSPNNKLQVIGAGVFGADYGQYTAASNGLLVQGNVGIGATTSSNKLDVWGNARIAGTGVFDSTLTALNGLIGYSGVTAPTNGLAVFGNVGVGTTSPLGQLHVVGQCVTGETKLRRRRRRKTEDGRLIDEWDEVEIKDIQEGDEILTLDEKTGEFVTSKVNALMDMGTKEIIKITTISGKTIRTTSEHPYLTISRNKKEDRLFANRPTYLFIDETGMGNDPNQPYFGIGALAIRNTIDLNIKLHNIFEKLLSAYGDKKDNMEFKFSNITRDNKDFYNRVLDTLFASTEWGFAALAVKKGGKGWTPYSYWKRYLGNLIELTNLFPEEKLNLVADYLSKPNVSPKDLKSILYKKNIENILQLESQGSLLLQVADILLGAIAFKLREEKIKNPKVKEAKQEIADRVWDKLQANKKDGYKVTLYRLNAVMALSPCCTGNITKNLPIVKPSKWVKVKNLQVGAKIATTSGWEEIAKIEHLPSEQVFDIEVEGTHNFVGGHYINRKTGQALTPEQEAIFASYLAQQKTRLSASSLTECNANAQRPSLSTQILPQNIDNVKYAALSETNVDLTGIEPANPGSSDLNVHQHQAHIKPLSQILGLDVKEEDIMYGGIVAHNTAIFSGNVGIGVTSPTTFNLQVAGSIGPNANNSYDLGSDGYRFRDLYLGPNTLHLGTSTSDEYTMAYDTTNNRLGFNVNGSGPAEVTFDSSGNVGIGATTSSNKLDVWGNARIAGSLTVDSTLTALNGLIGYSGVTAPTSGLAVSGNLGVGTTSPLGQLHVVGQCVAKGTRIRRRRKGKNGEWIEEDISVEDIKPEDEVLSLNDKTGEWKWNKVEKTQDKGIQQTIKIVTQKGKWIETTNEHPYLTIEKDTKPIQESGKFEVDLSSRMEKNSDTYVAVANKTASEMIRVTAREKQILKKKLFGKTPRLFPPTIYALCIVEIIRRGRIRPSQLKICTDYPSHERRIATIINHFYPGIVVTFGHVGHGTGSYADRAAYQAFSQKKKTGAGSNLQGFPAAEQLHDDWLHRSTAHTVLTNKDYHKFTDLSIHSTGSGLNATWKKVKYLKPGMVIATVNGWEKIQAKYSTGRKQVYDLQIEGTHNFVGNDIVAHNTYINGNLGIGTYSGLTVPSNGLAVSGNVGIGITTANSLLSVAGGAHIGGTYQGISAPANGLFVDGNVGIGATTSSNKLDVWGNARIAGTGVFDSTLTALNALIGYTGVTAPTNGLAVFGNVGVGTTSPLGQLHVVGQCVAQGTRIRRRSRRKGKLDDGDWKMDDEDGSLKLDDPTSNLQPHGLSSNIQHLTSDWIYEDIPVEDIKPGDEVLSLNDKTGDFEWHKVEATLDKGIQTVYRLQTQSGKWIETTAEHPYLTVRQQWGDKLLSLAGHYRNTNQDDQTKNYKDQIYQNQWISHNYLFNFKLAAQNIPAAINPNIILMGSNLSSAAGRKTEAKNTKAISDDISDNLSSLPSVNFHQDNIGYSQNYNTTLLLVSDWAKVVSLGAGDYIATSEGWEKIISIQKIGRKQTYDLQIAGTHNFVGNDIVAHNTYINGNLGIGTYSGLTVPTNGLAVSGNVGIGTTTANYNLSVVGTSNVTGAATFGSTLGVTGALTLSANNAALTFSGSTPSLTSGSSVFGLFAGGNVGIGTTGNLYGGLTVRGAGTGTNITLQTYGSGLGQGLTVLDNGNVGIGTTGPAEKLELSGGRLRLPQTNEPSTPTLNFGDGDTGFFEVSDDQIGISIAGAQKWVISSTVLGSSEAGGARMLQTGTSATVPYIYEAGDSNTGMGAPGADLLSLITGGNEVMRITNQGNIGIGATLPQAKLVIQGNVGIGYTGANQAIPANGLAVSGNVGLGTTSPLGQLHVVGQCVAWDSRIRIRRRRRSGGQGQDDEIDYDYLEVKIADVLPGDEALTLNEYTREFEYQRVEKLLDMGRKGVYEVTTLSGKKIKTTGNHPYLVKLDVRSEKLDEEVGSLKFENPTSNFQPQYPSSNFQHPTSVEYSSPIKDAGWVKVINLEVGDEIAVKGLMPGMGGLFRSKQNQTGQEQNNNYQQTISNSSTGKKILGIHSNLLFSVNQRLAINPTIPSNKLTVNNSWYSLIEETPRILGATTNTPNQPEVRLIMMEDKTSMTFLGENNPIGANVAEQNIAVNQFGWDTIVSIKYLGYEHVYDLQISDTHNFLANDIVAHNTYINGNLGIGTYSGLTLPSNGLAVSGNVGIGTTTANYNLSVVGTSNVTGAATFGSTLGVTGALTLSANNAALSFTGSTPSLTSGSSVFGLFAGGNVGIGTTGNLYGGLTVRGAGTGTNIALQTYGSNLTQGLTVLDNGNVGIGTTSPQAKLSVYGTGLFGSAPAAYGRLSQNLETNTSGNYGGMAVNTWSSTAAEAGILDFNRSKSGTIGTHAAVATGDYLGYIEFRGSEGSAFQNAGGIRAVVNGTVSAPNHIPMDMVFTTTVSGGSESEKMRLTGTGNVGIGFTSPTNNLHIRSLTDAAIYLDADSDNSTEDDNAFIKLTQDNRGVNAIFGLIGDSGTDPENIAYTGTWQNSILLGGRSGQEKVQLGTSSIVRMTIDTDGNLGIGTTTANSLLSVAGSAHIGSLYQSIVAPTNGLFVDGNVGIGATTSSNKLDVWGNARIAGTGVFDSTLTALNGLIGFSGVTAPTSGLAVSGNVGVGTTSPLGNLHVVGQCVVGETKLRRRRRRKTEDGRLIDEWEEVEIKDIEPGDEILTLDENSGEFVTSKVKALMDMGIHQTYLLITESGKQIRTTSEHPYLIREKDYLSAEMFFALNLNEEQQRKQQYYQAQAQTYIYPGSEISQVNHSSSSISSILTEVNTQAAKSIISSANTLRSAIPNSIISSPAATLVRSDDITLSWAGRSVITNFTLPEGKLPVNQGKKWVKVSQIKAGMEVATVDGWEKIVLIKKYAREQVFDIEVEGTHNFVGNDIVAHNTAIFSGNVGIGVTSPTTFNLQVAGSIGPNANNSYDLGSDGYRFRDLYLGPNTLHLGTSTSDEYVMSYDTTNNRLGFNVNGSGPAEIVFDSNGNLGIGTTNPLTSLYVNGNAMIGYSSGAPASLASGLAVSGNVGIGTTNPAQKLDVNGDIAITPAEEDSGDLWLYYGDEYTGLFGNLRHGGNNEGFRIAAGGNNSGSGDLTFWTDDDSSPIERMRIDYNGNVGIGTSSPLSLLSVAGGAHIGGTYQGISAPTNGLFVDGNVGIGATTSSNKLDVWGNARIAGTGVFDSTLTALNGLIGYSGITAPTNGLAVFGNVGVGTTSPLGQLHVVGQCVTQGTRIRRRRRRKEKLDDGDWKMDEEDGNWKLDKQTSNLQPHNLASNIKHLTSDDYIYEDIPVEDIKPDDEVLSLNDQTGTWEWHKAEKTMDMGIQEVFELLTKTGKSIQTTANHPYLVRVENSTKKSARADFGDPTKVGSDLAYHLDSRIPQDNSFVKSDKKGVEVAGFAPAGPWMISQIPYSSTPTPLLLSQIITKWVKVSQLKKGMEIATVDGFEEIVSIKKVGRKQTYDLQIEGTHNFVGGHYIDGRTGQTLSLKDEQIYFELLSANRVSDTSFVDEDQYKSNGQKTSSNIPSINPFINLVNSHNDLLSKIIAKYKNSIVPNTLTVKSKNVEEGTNVVTKNAAATLEEKPEYTRNADEVKIISLINQMLTEKGASFKAEDLPYIVYGGIVAHNTAIFSGNVGIGVTSPTTFNLQVAGSIGPNANDTYDLGSDAYRFKDLYLGPDTLHIGTSTSDEYTIAYDTTNNRLGFNVNGSGPAEIVFDSNGYVGIGATLPQAKLVIQGNVGIGYTGANQAIPANGLAVSGNVGLGTTSPLGQLHVVGQCVTGETKLRRRRRRKTEDGRLIDEWDEVEIKDIQPGDEILTLDEKTGEFVTSKVKALMDMGKKDIIKITTISGKTIKTTAEHPYLVKTANDQKPRVGVFFDAANLYFAGKRAGWKVDPNKLYNLIAKEAELSLFNVYVAVPSVTDSDRQGTIDFINHIRKEIDVKTKPVKYIRSGAKSKRKGDVDVEIVLDIARNVDNLDLVIVVSGDSDYLELVNFVENEKGKQIGFAGFKRNMAWELRLKKHLFVEKIRAKIEFKAKSASAKATVDEKNPDLSTGATILPYLYQNIADLSRGEWVKVKDIKRGQKIAVAGRFGKAIFEKVIKIEHLPSEQVFDIEVEGTHNFVGGHYINRKTGKALTQKQEEAYAEYLKYQKTALADGFVASVVGKPTIVSQAELTIGYHKRPELSSDNNCLRGPDGIRTRSICLRNSRSAISLPAQNTEALSLSDILGLDVNEEDIVYGGIVAHNTYINGNLGIGTYSGLTVPSNGLAASGNVGIGLTTANSQLSISNNAHIGSLYQGTVAPTNGLFVDGNVGIGATTSSNKLDVWGNARIAGTGVFDSTLTALNGLIGFSGVTAPTSGLAVSGNVGVGTTSPLGQLHVVGQCVTGDTRLRRRRRRRRQGSGARGKDGKWEDYFEDVQIKNIKPGDEILTLDENTGRFITSKVKALKEMGIKEIFELTTSSGKTIRTTGNHPYLTLTKDDIMKSAREVGHLALTSHDSAGVMANIRGNSANFTGVTGVSLLNSAILSLSKDSKNHRIAVFIDAANLEKSVEKIGFKVHYKNLKRLIGALGSLTYIGYFTVATSSEQNVNLRQSLLRFGYTVVTKPLKLIRTSKGLKPKADVDVEITTEVMEHKDDFDLMILFSGDSDFYYPIKRLQEKYKKKVLVISTRYSVSKELLKTADRYIDIAKLKEEIARGQSFDNAQDKKESPSFATGDSSCDESNLTTANINIPDILPFVNPFGKLRVDTELVECIKHTGEWTKVNQLKIGQYVATLGKDKQPAYEKITSIKKVKREQVFDIEVEGTHNFVGNDIVAHNTYINGNLGIGAYSGLTVPSNGLAVSGNVGIGTTTSNSTLSVAGSAHIGSLYQGISAPTNGLFVDGNVGIGTTTSSNKLDVWGNARIAGTLTVDGNTTIGGTITPAGQFLAIDGSAAAPAYSFANDTNTGIYRQSENILRLTTAGYTTEGITIDGQTNSWISVGIGTTGPVRPLHVLSNGRNEPVRIQDNRSGLNWSLIDWVQSDGTRDWGIGRRLTTGNFGVFNETANDMVFSIENLAPANSLYLNASGNIGIGISSAPDRALHVASTINITSSMASLMGVGGTQLDISGATTNAAKKLVLGIDTTDNYGVIQAGNTDGTTYNLALQPGGGYVGIGTTSPGVALEIYGTTFNSSSMQLTRNQSGETNYPVFTFMRGNAISSGDQVGGFWFDGPLGADEAYATIITRAKNTGTYAGQIDFITASGGTAASNTKAPDMSIASGNVGIGMSAPDRTLQVASTINITSSIAGLMGVGGTQLDISGATTNAAKKLVLGVDTTDNYGVIQAGNTDGTAYNLALLPAGGNVGIGVTSPNSKLEILEDGAYFNVQGVSNELFLNNNAYWTGSQWNRISPSRDSAQLYFDEGTINTLRLRMAESGTNPITFTDVIVFQRDGNVGIGTSSPLSLLSVAGGAHIGALYQGTAAPANGLFVDGNVGIGATTSSNKLDVWGDARIAGTGIFDSTLTALNGLIGFSGVTAPTSGLAISGNVGVGTTSPLGQLHVVGQCVTGDTKLRRRRRRSKIKNQKSKLSGGWDPDDFEDIRIDQIQPGDEILTLDEKTGEFITSKVHALMDMGEKEITKITTISGKTIRTTSEHPYLVKNQEAQLENLDTNFLYFKNFENVQNQAELFYKEILEGETIRVPALDDQQIYFSREGWNHLVEEKKSRFETMARFFGLPKVLPVLLLTKVATYEKSRLEPGTSFWALQGIIEGIWIKVIIRETQDKPKHFYSVIWKGEEYRSEVKNAIKKGAVSRLYPRRQAWESLTFSTFNWKKYNTFVNDLQVAPKHLRGTGTRPILHLGGGETWTKVKNLKVGAEIATVDGWEEIAKIEHLPSEQVFDIEVEGTHNFVGNDIVAHNTAIFSGNVGIGATSPTTFNLQIAGSIGPNANDQYDLGSDAYRFQDIYLGPGSIHLGTSTSDEYVMAYDTTNNRLGFNVNGSGPAEIVFDSNGNVGIGTTGPQYALDIVGNSALWQSVYGTDDGLVGYWSFSEGTGTKAYDRSPYGNDGTLTGATGLPTWSTGKYGNALSFDGVDDYVDAGGDSSLKNNSVITVEFWVKPSDVASVNQQIMSNADAGGPSSGFLINTYTDGQIGWQPRTSAGSPSTYAVAGTVTDGNWYHFVAVYDGTDSIVYVNGVEKDRDTSAGTLTTAAGNLIIGSPQTHSANFFKGLLDEVRIYKRALSADEVKAHYLRGNESGKAVAMETSTTAGSLYGLRGVVTDTGVVTTGTDTTYGSRIDVTRTGATGGTINTYGQYIALTADNAGAGTSNSYGLYVDTSGSTADNNYGAYFSGNVGIGATLPQARLVIQGNVGIGYTGANQAIPVNGLAVFGNVGIGTTTANSTLSVAGSTHIGSLYQGISAPTNGLFVDGNVGIGATTSSNKLDVWGDERITGAITIDSLGGAGNRAVYSDANGQLTNSASDIRLKTSIEGIPDTVDILAALDKLRGVYFNWNQDIPEARHFGTQRELGMIAQEVEAVLPELVGVNADGYRSLNYAQMTGFLVEVGKAQQKELVSQGQTLDKLNNLLQGLTLDSKGNLVIPALKTGTITLDPSIGMLTDYSLQSTAVVGSQSAVSDLGIKIASLEERIAALENQLTDYSLQSTATPSAQITGEATASAQIATPSAQVASDSIQIATDSAEIATSSASATWEESEPTSQVSKLKLTPPDILLATSSATLDSRLLTLDSYSDATVSGQLTAYQLNVQEGFKSLGKTTLGDTIVAGDFTIDGTMSITGNSINSLACPNTGGSNSSTPGVDCGILYLQNGPLASGLDILNGQFTFTKDGTLTVNGTVLATQFAVKANTTAGTGTVLAGQIDTIIENAYVDENSVILITPRIPLSQALAVADKIKGGFLIQLAHTENKDIKFDYLIVGVKQ